MLQHRGYWVATIVLVSVLLGSCELLLVGGAATVGYKIGTDEKTVTESIDDSVITSSVKTRLIEDRHVRALNIDVDTNLGEVTLSGYVRSQEEINRAVTIAKSVKGVKKVTSLLKLRSPQ